MRVGEIVPTIDELFVDLCGICINNSQLDQYLRLVYNRPISVVYSLGEGAFAEVQYVEFELILYIK